MSHDCQVPAANGKRTTWRCPDCWAKWTVEPTKTATKGALGGDKHRHADGSKPTKSWWSW